jgi:DNA-binding NtrC family response regulator
MANEQLTGSPDAVPAEVLARFTQYEWPGNVRELRNAVARYIALGDQPPGAPPAEAFEPLEAAPSTLGPDVIALPFALARRRALAQFERAYVEQVLAAHGGNVSHAARASGLALRYFRLVKARMKKGT